MKMKKKLSLLIGLFMLGLANQANALMPVEAWADEFQISCTIAVLSPGGGYVMAAGTKRLCISTPWSICFYEPCNPIIWGHPDV